MSKLSKLRPSVPALALVAVVVAVGAFVQCGGGSPTQPPTTVPTTVATTTTTTLASGIVLPSGMTCSPTPPPLYGMQLKIHANDPGRYILDSKPLVVNVDGYCERVNGVSGRFCETRPEVDAQREACDYLAVGKASSGRWGPDWYWNGQPCDGANTERCRSHPDNQFNAIAKVPGTYEACASSLARVQPDEGTRCGRLELGSLN